MTIRPSLAIVLLVSWWIACSATSAASGAGDCGDVVDDAERLACYDRIARQPDGGEDEGLDPAPATAAQSEDEIRPTGTTDGGEDVLQAEADFGVEPRMRQAESEKSKLREIYATVVSIDQTSSGKRVFTLDNGHVWLEQTLTRRLKLKPGESVRIKAGSLGSYKLFGEGKVSTKVERIQ